MPPEALVQEKPLPDADRICAEIQKRDGGTACSGQEMGQQPPLRYVKIGIWS